MYNPGATVAPFAANLLENIKKHPNLQIDRIVPIDATIGPYSELVKTVQAISSN